jgi:GNAT superfamily N-acetyltransferase
MNQAKSLLVSNPNPKWVTDSPFNERCRAIGKSFAGSKTVSPEPIVSWIFREMIPEMGDAEREDVYKFILGFAVEDFQRHGGLFFGHPAGDEQEEMLQSCSAIREFDPSIEFHEKRRWDEFVNGFMGFWLFMTAKIKGTLPRVFLDHSALEKLGEIGLSFSQSLKDAHKEYGPKERHIYVFIVSTDPDRQGCGLGSQLMNQISEIADAAGRACYLECIGEKNRGFYEKHGYKVAHELLMKDEKDGSSITIYCMVRKPLQY